MSLIRASLRVPGRQPLTVTIPWSRTDQPVVAVLSDPSHAGAGRRVRLSARVLDAATLREHARQLAQGALTLPVRVGGSATELRVAHRAPGGPLIFTASNGLSGELGLTHVSGEPSVEAMSGLEVLGLVAVVAILTIGGMVIASSGGSFGASAPGVEVSAEGEGEGEGDGDGDGDGEGEGEGDGEGSGSASGGA